MRLFHAVHQWSVISSWDPNTQLEDPLLRINYLMFLTGLCLAHLGGNLRSVMFSATTSLIGHVPSGLVEEENCMCAHRYLGMVE